MPPTAIRNGELGPNLRLIAGKHYVNDYTSRTIHVFEQPIEHIFCISQFGTAFLKQLIQSFENICLLNTQKLLICYRYIGVE